LQTKITEDKDNLAALFQQKELIDLKIQELEDQKEFMLANLGLIPEAGGNIQQLTGYIPVQNEKQIIDFLEKEDVVYLLEEPENTSEIPIKLKNRPFGRLFEPITKIYGLPQYSELDATPFFAPFFALFFGMCLGDLGYGLVIFIATTIAFIKLKNKSAKSLAILGMVFGFMTIIGGLALDTFFGLNISKLGIFPDFLKKLIVFPAAATVNDPPPYNDIMAFAIMLGVLQVLFGFILQMINRGRNIGFTGILQPLGTFLLIAGVVLFGVGGFGADFVIGPIPIGKILHSLGQPEKIGIITAISGVALVLLFNSLDKKIWIRPLTGLWEMYGIASGIPGDIVSYIRLFALGLAGGLLGQSMNQIAADVYNGSVLTIIPMLLILVAGHAINFALAALGAFVHPLRLTFVEFYKAVGFSGGGKEYKPFMKKFAMNGGKQ